MPMTVRCGDTLLFQTLPVIAAGAAVGGKKEGEGPLGERFDYVAKNDRMGQRSWELAESELSVNRMEHVELSCCVYDREREKIVLYYVGSALPKEVTAYLKECLPRYMIPNMIEALEQMPLTANGKIDRVLLKNRAGSKQERTK